MRKFVMFISFVFMSFSVFANEKELLVLEDFNDFQKLVIYSSNDSRNIQNFKSTDFFARITTNEGVHNVSIPEDIFMEIVDLAESFKRISEGDEEVVESTKTSSDDSACYKSEGEVAKRIFISKDGMSGGNLLLIQEWDSCTFEKSTFITYPEISERVAYILGMVEGVRLVSYE